MTTAVICVAVFAGSLLISWRLARFLQALDQRDAERLVIAEAERILHTLHRRPPGTGMAFPSGSHRTVDAAAMSGTVTLADYRRLECNYCFAEIAKRDLPAHIRECPARAARIAHPSSRGKAGA